MDAKALERMQLWGPSPLLTASSPLDGGEAGRRHYVVRYRGRGPAPARDVARIVGAVHVLDHASRMLLVEGSASQIARLAADLPYWLVREERAFAVGRASVGGPEHDVDSSLDDSEGIDDDLTGDRRETGRPTRRDRAASPPSGP